MGLDLWTTQQNVLNYKDLLVTEQCVGNRHEIARQLTDGQQRQTPRETKSDSER